MKFLRWFAPPAYQPRVSPQECARLYPRFRWSVFEAAFVGYAAFYLVRNNFAPVSKEIGAALHYDKVMLGNILAATAISYGIGKFVMGFLGDRSDARKYLATGMLLTACVNFIFGTVHSYQAHLWLWALNGLIQGMGYAPCTRGLSHWYSVRERGTIFGIWNVSHNIGGGVVGYLAAACTVHWGWPSAFYVPGAIAAVLSIYLFWRMRDTPQSVGLPPIEEYKNDHPASGKPGEERELTMREILLVHILPNKNLWILAIANIFVYIARYSMVDWGPTYLKEVKGASTLSGGMSTTIVEFSGAAGMLFMGWFSDKIGGLRSRVGMLSLLPLLLAFPALRFTPKGMLWLDMTLFAIIGFFVYTPVLFSGVISLDLTTKKAVGTAAGFVGFFGYVGRVIQARQLGYIAQHYGWDPALYSVLACTVIAIVLLGFLWNVRPHHNSPQEAKVTVAEATAVVK